MRKFFLCLAVVSGAWIGLGAQKRADQQHLIDPESFSMILWGIRRDMSSTILISLCLNCVRHGL